ncbi:MAG: mandelate racemase/muconate lactonizing enzyme family protein, partial [Candidatus Rokuibacteriota bacterium]
MVIRSIETLNDGHLVVVRVRTADGRAGVGQVPPTNVDLVEEVLHRQVAPYVIGQDADDIDGLHERCRDDQAKF